ncbi:hypothetical protein ACPDHL_05260 [Myroides sp. C15-4]|uniref:hypothetical protein n=1 Tax=Myroides sp. C15-4 TaxID=3400532 RepID=UPI003D2F90FF
MKKLKLRMIALAFIAGFTMISCSSDDNKEAAYDVYNLPYTPLTDLSELGKETYFYVGIKIEGYKTQLIPPTKETCLKEDKIVALYNDDEMLVRLDYKRSGINCKGYDNIRLTQNKIVQPGILNTNLYVAGTYEKADNGDMVLVPSDSNERFEGDIEIGFQGRYLRIEDRMSHYSRPANVNKVYLYFEKISE